MLIVLPTYIRDYDRALKLAAWIKTLGGTANHTCLLTTARSIENADELLDVLRLTFKSVERLIPHEDATANWGEERASAHGANIMFQHSARHIAHFHKVPFLFLEPDAVPLCPDWLDRIEAAYNAQKKPFMGAYVDFKPAPPHMSGIAVYPANVALHATSAMRCREGAWDLNGAKEILPKMTRTNLIQHVWKIGGELPMFPRDMGIISPEAVIFHRDKFLGIVDTLSGSTESRRATELRHGTPTVAGATANPVAVTGSRNQSMSGSSAPPAQTLRKAGDAPSLPIHHQVNAPATSEPEAGAEMATGTITTDMPIVTTTVSNVPTVTRIRHHVHELRHAIDGNPGHIATLHRLLRDAHLLRPAKKRKHGSGKQ